MATRRSVSWLSSTRRSIVEVRARCRSQGVKFRSFHASRKQTSQLLDVCCISTYHLLDGLHSSTGLSWGLTLPLLALIVQTSLRAPTSIWARKRSQVAASIRPLSSAWSPIIQARIKSQYGAQGPEACGFLIKEEWRTKVKELHRAFGIKRWVAFLPLLQLPFWLLPMETLRRMCGLRESLLSYLTGWASGATAAEQTSEAASAGIPVEASLASEGLLWFPDLLVADPKLILPFVLSGALWMNISRHERQFRQDNIELPKKQIYLQRFLKMMALVAVPVGLQIPSAMVLYWTSSALVGLAQNTLIDRIWALPKTPTPCKPRQKNLMKAMSKT